METLFPNHALLISLGKFVTKKDEPPFVTKRMNRRRCTRPETWTIVRCRNNNNCQEMGSNSTRAAVLSPLRPRGHPGWWHTATTVMMAVRVPALALERRRGGASPRGCPPGSYPTITMRGFALVVLPRIIIITVVLVGIPVPPPRSPRQRSHCRRSRMQTI